MTIESTRAELDQLARSPRDQLSVALAAGASAPEVAALVDRLVAAYDGFTDGFAAFAATLQAWTFEHHGVAGLEALARDELAGTLAYAHRHGTGDPAERARLLDEVREVLGRSPVDADAVLGAFDALSDAIRTTHDVANVRVVAMLSHVYRTHGVEGLEGALRFAGEQTLLQFMPRDLARPARERVRTWTRMMLGNFASIRVDETDDAYVITQDPCGTCTRQIEHGCYEPPIGLAVVDERCPLTFGAGGMPVYRTHVAVMHDLLPIEATGVPWPAIECPSGLGTGPCRITLYKDPAVTPQRFVERTRR